MDFEAGWSKALEKTEIVRPRVKPLSTFSATRLPYIFLAESVLNTGDSVVRKGEVLVEKPSIILPPDLPQFEGFRTGETEAPDMDRFANFLLVRGVRFPSLKFNNRTQSLEIHEGRLSAAIEHYRSLLQNEENLSTGLVIGPEDVWQLSVLIFIASQVLRQADGDINRLINEYKKKNEVE